MCFLAILYNLLIISVVQNLDLMTIPATWGKLSQMHQHVQELDTYFKCLL